MSLVVNNNLMAANVARNLNSHYGRLATSTQRLSSGLRVNSAADDAAGLAIRELQRADIAALHQGARNANDAISMIQVADGSLGIIDEKLIRMKELAEQAATGTYDSTQRLMIESEYQAMASEITRIANATDFNGTKLLDGTLAGDHDGSGMVSEGKIKIHFGTGNDSAEDYYYIEIGECTSEALGLGNNSTWQDVTNRALTAFQDSLEKQIRNDSSLTPQQQGEMLNSIKANSALVQEALANATDYTQAYKYFNDAGDLEKYWPGNSDLMARYLAEAAKTVENEFQKVILDEAGAEALLPAVTDTKYDFTLNASGTVDAADVGANDAVFTTYLADVRTALANSNLTQAQQDLINAKLDGLKAPTVTAGEAEGVLDTRLSDWKDTIKNTLTSVEETVTEIQDPAALDKFWNGLRTTEKEKLKYAWGQAAISKLASGDKSLEDYGVTGKSLVSDTDAETLMGNATTPTFTVSATGATADEVSTINGQFANYLKEVKTALQNDTTLNLTEAQKQFITDKLDSLTVPTIEAGELEDSVTSKFEKFQGQIVDALSGLSSFTTIPNEMGQQALKDMQAKVGHMDFAGHTIETQEDAQMALTAINNAIVSKDKIRAHLGAAQNRLENTVSNLNIQAENLQAAESRISDVDVATEMTQFVRNQILTQSAVAMLSQANSLPQMAMQLIGG